MTATLLPVPRREGTWDRWGWLMAIVWLFFLYFPVSAIVESTAGIAPRVLAWVGVGVFTCSYVVGFVFGFRGMWGRPSLLVRIAFFLQIACALATIPAIGPEALGLAPFIMSYAAYGMRRSWHWVTTGTSVVLAVVVLIVYRGGDGSITLFFIIVLLAVVNSINSWLIGRSIDAERVKLELATSQEREAVARDVHDLIGHSLTVVKLKAELAARLVDRDPERAKAEMAQIAALTGEAIAGVRSTVTGLRASTLDEQLEVARAGLESAGIELEVDGTAAAISPAQSITASWILREATTNILRHSGASRVRVALAPGTVCIQDDGRGVAAPAGNGMRGMAERATAAGAVLRIDPVPTGGTRVDVRW